MKRCFPIILVVLLLFGCRNDSLLVDEILLLRNRVASSSSCSFVADVTVDYGDSIYSFSADCCLDAKNNMEITILAPASIAGIKGRISADSGKLTFDEQVLAFEMVANGQVTPICAPWLLMKALRGGYISMCSSEDTGIFVRIDDSYKDADFGLDIRLDNQNIPVSAEIVWEGKRIVSMTIKEFVSV